MAAFLNALREEGTKADCLKMLERMWSDELVLRAENAQLRARIAALEAVALPEKAVTYLDELEAAQAARAWIDPIAYRLADDDLSSVTVEIQSFWDKGGTGGVMLCWHSAKLAAAATIFRDQFNRSVLLKWEASEQQARTTVPREDVERAREEIEALNDAPERGVAWGTGYSGAVKECLAILSRVVAQPDGEGEKP